MSETDLKRNVTRLLELSGWLVTRVNSGKRGGVRLAKAGTADLFALAPGGHYVEVETKMPKTGRASPEQLKRCSDVVRRGGTYRFVNSMTEAKELVEEMARKKFAVAVSVKAAARRVGT